MSLLDSVFEGIKKNFDLADSSVKILKRNIEKLADNKEVKDLNFLKDTKKIENTLSYYKPNTQQSFINAIVKVLYATEGETDAYNYWRKRYNKLVIDLNKKSTDEKTETQEENWVDWNDVLKKQNELIDKAIETKKWNDILNAFVLMLYTSNEPRRNQDYLDMVIIRSKKYPYDEKLSKDKNYLLLKPNLKEPEGKYYFVFNKFKTAKSFGQQVFVVPNDIELFFDKYYYTFYPAKKGKEDPLLVDKEGRPLTSVNAITRILNKVFDKKVGASMLRHIYLTHKYGETYKEREIVSKKMSHSISTQHKYVKKNQ